MQHVGEFQRMGSKINVQKNTAFVEGRSELTATSLTGGDLRSCAAMVLVSLVAKGSSVIQGLNHLDRGYENFEQKLNSIGANISRTSFAEEKPAQVRTKTIEAKHNFCSGTEVA